MENRSGFVSINDVPEILASIRLELAKLTKPIVAFQAIWDGDTQGWRLILEAITKNELGQYESHWLWDIRQSELVSFNMALKGLTYKDEYNPSNIVRAVGETLAEEYGVPFYFPSPNKPDLDSPNWWELDQAIACTRCGKLVLQTSVKDGKCIDCHWEV